MWPFIWELVDFHVPVWVAISVLRFFLAFLSTSASFSPTGLCEEQKHGPGRAMAPLSLRTNTKGWGLFPLIETFQMTSKGSQRLSLAQAACGFGSTCLERKGALPGRVFSGYPCSTPKLKDIQMKMAIKCPGNGMEWNGMKIPCGFPLL